MELKRSNPLIKNGSILQLPYHNSIFCDTNYSVILWLLFCCFYYFTTPFFFTFCKVFHFGSIFHFVGLFLLVDFMLYSFYSFSNKLQFSTIYILNRRQAFRNYFSIYAIKETKLKIDLL